MPAMSTGIWVLSATADTYLAMSSGRASVGKGAVVNPLKGIGSSTENCGSAA